MNIIFSIAIAQGLFLVLLLIGKKENHKANLILAALIFSYSLFICQVLAVNIEFYKIIPHLFAVFVGLPLLFGPLHYLYVRTLITNQNLLYRKDLWHFVLYFFNWLYFLPLMFKDKDDLITLFVGFITEHPKNYTLVGLWVITLQGLIYMALSLKLINRYSKNIKKEYSSIEKINLIWLNNITIGTLLVWILVFIKNIVSYFVSSELFYQRETPIALGIMALIYLMGYLGLMQTEIFSPSIIDNKKDSEISNNEDQISEIVSRKYEKSGLSEEKAKKALSNLIELMEKEKVYHKSNLTLKDLAKQLNISTHNLSEIINTHQKQSFFDFINGYRVKDVKDSMLKPDKKGYTLLALALEAGFNSKSSFNAIFKKHVNMTPSQYRKGLTD